MFCHGWPLNSDLWDEQMLFLMRARGPHGVRFTSVLGPCGVHMASVLMLLSGRSASWETHVLGRYSEEPRMITHDTASTIGYAAGRRMQ